MNFVTYVTYRPFSLSFKKAYSYTVLVHFVTFVTYALYMSPMSHTLRNDLGSFIYLFKYNPIGGFFLILLCESDISDINRKNGDTRPFPIGDGFSTLSDISDKIGSTR